MHQRRSSLARAAASALVSTALLSSIAHADFTATRRVAGLNQPLFVSQAPGNNNDLFIVQRSGTNNTVGDIVRYNPTTNSTSLFLNIGGSLVQDGGLLSMAFHPDYATNGRFYVTALVGGTNKLYEYQTPSAGGTPTLQRTLLSYDNPRTQHTIDWVGFKPGATGAERDYLYVTTGDGGIQANEANFTNRAQDKSSIFGKVLRLDVNPVAPDAYAGDANKNFAIPSINPFVGGANGALGEVFATGFRNPWRASFDKQTGDLFVGDVGFDLKEEVDFHKNDAGFNSGRDFGWARREGTAPNPNATHAGAKGDSIDPIYEVNHNVFNSITGGYVYRGPIVELQGKYIFGDFNTSTIYGITFDRDTDAATFNGSTAGVSGFEDLTAKINSLIAANGGGGPITGLVSFGEDHAGNLYLISLGTGNIFNPALGTGSIYTLNAIAAPEWNIATGGNWNASANWSSNTVPTGLTATAMLSGPAGSGTRNVSLAAPVTLQRLTFDNATANYTVSGPSALTINANPAADAVVVASGNHTIAAPLTLSNTTRFNIASASTLTVTGPVSATGKTIFKRGDGTLTLPATNAARFAVNAGTLRLSGTGNSIVGGITVDGGANLDLTASTLIIDYAAGANPLASVQSLITSGALNSSTLAAGNMAIGYFDTSLEAMPSFNGAAGLDETTLIARATLRGDANLDRTVNFADLVKLAQNYNQAGKLWQHGDANADGTVNFADLVALAQNYNGTISTGALATLGGESFAADWSLAVSLVPEPTTLSALAAVGVSALKRRRRR